MDDLAPAPAQRMFDSIAQTPDRRFSPRRKAAKKAQPATAQQDAIPETETEVEPDPGANHQLDVRA